jgi:hypothetical protein
MLLSSPPLYAQTCFSHLHLSMLKHASLIFISFTIA